MLGSVHGQHRQRFLTAKPELLKLDQVNLKGTFKQLLGQMEMQRLLSKIITSKGRPDEMLNAIG